MTSTSNDRPNKQTSRVHSYGFKDFMKLFFQKEYFEDQLAQERDEGNKNPRNWCDRNLVIKEPSQSRLYFLWELVFMSAFLIEIVLVPYTACRQNQDEDILNMEHILNDYTKELEQVIDVIWVMNITLSFLTPFEQDISYNDKF